MDIRGGDRETLRESPRHPNTQLIGLRGLRVRIEPEVDRRIDNRNDARVLPRRLIERGGRRRRQSRMHRGRLTSKNPLMKTTIARSEHGPAVSGEPRSEAEARRQDVPRIQSAKTTDGRPGLIALRIMRRQVRADRAIVIETQSQTGGEPIGKSDVVRYKQARGDEFAAAGCWLAERCLDRLACIVCVAHDAALKCGPPGVPTVL